MSENKLLEYFNSVDTEFCENGYNVKFSKNKFSVEDLISGDIVLDSQKYCYSFYLLRDLVCVG